MFVNLFYYDHQVVADLGPTPASMPVVSHPELSPQFYLVRTDWITYVSDLPPNLSLQGSEYRVWLRWPSHSCFVETADSGVSDLLPEFAVSTSASSGTAETVTPSALFVLILLPALPLLGVRIGAGVGCKAPRDFGGRV